VEVWPELLKNVTPIKPIRTLLLRYMAPVCTYYPIGGYQLIDI